MKIAVIHGQAHRGITYRAARFAVDRLEAEGGLTAEFFLDRLTPCVGCNQCFFQGEAGCPHRRENETMIRAIEEADILVFSSPTYCMGMTGQMKVFFDHMAYRWMSHRPHEGMFRKTAIVVTTAAGSGAGKAARAIEENLFYWGLMAVYRLPVVVRAESWDQVPPGRQNRIRSRAERLALYTLEDLTSVRPQFKSKFMFAMMRQNQKGNDWNPLDRAHWQDRGWLSGGHPWRPGVPALGGEGQEEKHDQNTDASADLAGPGGGGGLGPAVSAREGTHAHGAAGLHPGVVQANVDGLD